MSLGHVVGEHIHGQGRTEVDKYGPTLTFCQPVLRLILTVKHL